jgi:hypothetical protein
LAEGRTSLPGELEFVRVFFQLGVRMMHVQAIGDKQP